MKSTWPWLLVVLLVLTNLLTGFLLLDQAVTLTHQSDALRLAHRQADLLSTLSLDLEKGLTKDSVITILETQYSEEFYKEESSDTISISNILLVFDEGELSNVGRM